MKKELDIEKEKKWNYIFITTYIFVFVWIILKNTGPYAYVFSDETTYSKFCRLLPFSQADIPCYLYFLIYRVTSYCGDAFLIGARLLNSVFFAFSGFFIYKIARNITSNIASNILVLLILIGPLNIYTSYFMPESLYMFCFWLFSWYLLNINTEDTVVKWSIGGGLFGMLTLVKPHAVFIIPSIIFYYGFLLMQSSRFLKFKSWIKLIVFLSIACFFKFIISYCIAGSAGITLFGPLYQKIGAGVATDGISLYIKILVDSFTNFSGHLLAILLVYGIPVFAVISCIARGSFKTTSTYTRKVIFYSIFIIANLILITVLFSASAHIKLGEEIHRIHMRYYNFALPLVYLSYIAILKNTKTFSFKEKIMLAISLFLITACLLSSDFFSYLPNFVDCPEFASIYSNKPLFIGICIAALALILFFIYKPNTANNIYIFIFLPFVSLFSIYGVYLHQNNLKIPNSYIRAGIFAKYNLDDYDKENLLLVGEQAGSLHHTKMIIDNPHTAIQVIKPDEIKFHIDTKYSNFENILVIGSHSIVGGKYNSINLNGFKFIKKINGISLDFRSAFRPSIISNVSGLSGSEAWGSWSIGKEIEIEFTSNLPESFTLKITAKAFKNNTSKDIFVQVGDIWKTMQLSDSLSEVSLDFHNSKPTKAIKIFVPTPTSPHEIGMNADERKIGIGFVSLSIEPLL